MLELVVIVMLLLGASYWIIIPLLRPWQYKSLADQETNETLSQLNLKKESAYATIKELEFDLNMGKLSEEDFEAMKRQIMLDAVEYLKEIDQLQSGEKRDPSAEEGIEKGDEKEVSAVSASRPRDETPKYCTKCGKRASALDRYCSNCGSELLKHNVEETSDHEN